MRRVVHAMIKFCLDVKECRNYAFVKHVQFRVHYRLNPPNDRNRHFNASEWAEDCTQCGHCDNCTRDPKSVIQSDVTLDAKRVLAVAHSLCSRKMKVTAAQLAQTARGTGEKAKEIRLTPENQVTLSFLVRPIHALLSRRDKVDGNIGHRNPYCTHAN
jgi:RecQ zinc-binding